MKFMPHSLRAAYFVLAMMVLGATSAYSQVSLSISLAPPPLQDDYQAACPGDGYLWTPGYWAYGDGAYYWVAGAWVQPPQIGFLWTPSYWAWDGNNYNYHSGYWGRNVGYYGGINYGHGYGGNGYNGGRWQGNNFSYNSAVNNIRSGGVHYYYADRAAIRPRSNRTSYSGANAASRAQSAAQSSLGGSTQGRKASEVNRPAQGEAQVAPANRAASHPGGLDSTFNPKAKAPAANPENYQKAQGQPRAEAQGQPRAQGQGQPRAEAQGQPRSQGQGQPRPQAQPRQQGQGGGAGPAEAKKPVHN